MNGTLTDWRPSLLHHPAGAVGKVTSTLDAWGQAPQGSFKWRVHHFIDKRLDAVPPSSRLVQSLPKGAHKVGR
jgi:hypothetical protein